MRIYRPMQDDFDLYEIEENIRYLINIIDDDNYKWRVYRLVTMDGLRTTRMITTYYILNKENEQTEVNRETYRVSALLYTLYLAEVAKCLMIEPEGI